LKRAIIRARRNFGPKIFCVGFNKTGTTSLKMALEGFHYSVGNQLEAEKLSGAYHHEKWDLIIRYCESACAFQDVPFSWPNLYRQLYDAYPDAKFILTVRDDEAQWYKSLLKFHTKRYGRLPTREDLQASMYASKGWEWDNYVNRYGADQTDIWNEEMRVNDYVKHNEDVLEFFRDKPGQLLVLNVSEPGAYQQLASFLKIQVPADAGFPWENRT
jgi:hypothetical protein